jgi:hypothetical protein
MKWTIGIHSTILVDWLDNKHHELRRHIICEYVLQTPEPMGRCNHFVASSTLPKVRHRTMDGEIFLELSTNFREPWEYLKGRSGSSIEWSGSVNITTNTPDGGESLNTPISTFWHDG